MNEQKINEGDEVSVKFYCREGGFTLCYRAEVKHVPSATGDYWVFNDLDNDKIHYVSEGCTVTLIKKGS